MDVPIVSSAGLGLNELSSTKNTCRFSVFQLYVIVFGLQVADFCKEKFRTIVVECLFFYFKTPVSNWLSNLTNSIIRVTLNTEFDTLPVSAQATAKIPT